MFGEFGEWGGGREVVGEFAYGVVVECVLPSRIPNRTCDGVSVLEHGIHAVLHVATDSEVREVLLGSLRREEELSEAQAQGTQASGFGVHGRPDALHEPESSQVQRYRNRGIRANDLRIGSSVRFGLSCQDAVE